MNQTFPHPEKTQTEEHKKQPTAFYKATRQILRASFGAALLAQDEMENFINRLIERGEMAENDARRLVREVKERRERLETEQLERKQKAAGKNPEIDLLVERINELARQIDELKRQKSQPDVE